MTQDEKFGFQPVIIIGAGRSGTNILRDTLCKLPGFGTWDCDEINPIWRHGNIAAENDEFSPSRASSRIIQFIRREFEKQWMRQDKPEFVVEKTCANSLRVEFVDAVVPEAQYLFLVRNGLDVVASAQKRWKGDMEIASFPYYWSKIRHTPIFDLPVYAWRFARARLGMLLGVSEYMSFWGPQFAGLADIDKNSPLSTLCAMQWNACIERSLGAFAEMSEGKYLIVHYESLTAEPQKELKRILDYLGNSASSKDIAEAVSEISSSAVGKGKLALRDEAKNLTEIMKPSLDRLGYETEAA